MYHQLNEIQTRYKQKNPRFKNRNYQQQHKELKDFDIKRKEMKSLLIFFTGSVRLLKNYASMFYKELNI